jgi:hypothetical protein
MPNTASTAAPLRGTMGLECGTEVMTLNGIRPIEALRAGDRIITRAGACSLRSLRRTAGDGYALQFDTPQVVLLGEGQVHSDTCEPFRA